MSKSPKTQFKQIRSEDFNGWHASFWLIKKHQAERESAYRALRVNMDRKLQNRFKRYLKAQVQGKEFHLEEYDFNNADGDDALFTIGSEATDFGKVQSAIEAAFDAPNVVAYSELLGSWAYVILFEKDGKRIFAWKKVSADTDPKKAKSRDAAFFLDHKLMDLDDKEIFVIYPSFDFFVFDGTTFIANKRQFEISMNFREGMKSNGEKMLSAFMELDLFEGGGIEILREFVGTNLHHLRKLSSIQKAGYYLQPDYIEKLIRVSKKEKWELKIKNGKIIVELETAELLLKLLNNDRLRSPINDELFDSAAKAPVKKKAN
ncbi:DUF4868 domain-containing protein [Pseudoxanthomonas mexicana]